MAASPFLDFVDQSKGYIPGGTAAIPSLLAGLMVKRPSLDMSSMLPLYQSIAQNAAGANQLAQAQSANYQNNYLPAAVNFNANAQGVGGESDLANSANRNASNFEGAFNAARGNATRDMAGINPNSGAAQARLGAIDAAYAPGVVDAMNKGRVEERKYGDTLRASALPFLATTPNFNAGTASALAGSSLVGQTNNMYRQQVGDVTKTLKLPFDAADEAKRAGKGATSGILDAIKARFPGGSPASDNSSNYTFNPQFSGGSAEMPDYG